MGRKKTTGNFETREELVREILGLASIHLPWSSIAGRVGVSEDTVVTIFYREDKR